MNSMVQSAVTSIAMVLAAVCAVLVAMGKLTPADASTLQTSVMAVVASAVALAVFIAKLLPHRDADKLLDASKVAGATVTINPLASTQAIAALASSLGNDLKVST